ncbi:MAG: flagellar filament capping protein FliD [Defluviitaleaceae bacterium]|nr:flagellar filament capping protein FliD [Defluviitaleaceae bacterium]
MSVYTSQMRFTGLSGIDTESMVNQLMRAQGVRLDRLRQENQRTIWQQAAYRGLATSMQGFASSFLSLTNAASLRLASTFKGNIAAVRLAGAESGAARVTSSANAAPGDYKLNILQLAQKESFTSVGTVGGTINGGVAITKANPLTEGDRFSVNLDGRGATFEISAADAAALRAVSDNPVSTDADYANAVSDMLNAKFRAAFGMEGGANKVSASVVNGRLNISTTMGHTVKVTDLNRINTAAGGPFDAGLLFVDEDSVQYTFTVASDDPEAEPKTITVALDKGMFTGNAQSDAKVAAAAINAALSKEKVTAFTASANADGTLKLTSSGTFGENYSITGLEGFGFSGAATIDATANTGAMVNKFGITGGSSTVPAETDALGKIFGDAVYGMSFSINGTEIVVGVDQTLGGLMKDIRDKTNAVLSYDSFSRTFKLEAKNSGADNGFTIADGPEGFLAGALRLDASGANGYTAAQDALVSVNGGPVLNRDSNDVDISGLRVALNEVTGSGPANALSISVTADTSGPMDAIKSFVDGYNAMIDAINKELITNRPKKDNMSYYEPLTDEQKSAMKDADVANWEAQAKTGLLYGDSILGSVAGAMRDMLYRAVDLGDGRKISLFEIGITTSSNYWDGGKLVIDEDKLRTALETRADDVAALFTKESAVGYRSGVNDYARLNDLGIAERLNDIINNAIGSNGSITKKAGSGIPGSLTETTSSMFLLIKSQNEKITDMLAYLRQRETDYYTMFSKMESAIMESNNQMSYLMAQLGM